MSDIQDEIDLVIAADFYTKPKGRIQRPLASCAVVYCKAPVLWIIPTVELRVTKDCTTASCLIRSLLLSLSENLTYTRLKGEPSRVTITKETAIFPLLRHRTSL